MAKNLSSRLVSLGISCGLLLLGLHGTANAVPLPAPELDPGTATGGIMLAVGAALLLLERFRHRQ
jgi:hypothetical protein